jgi:putative ABC transport system permease protein
MFANHLKIVLAQFRKYKLQALINIAGMAVGLAGCMLIAVYVLFELSYDDHYEKADRIYRVSNIAGERRSATTSALAAPQLMQDFPQIQAAARVYGNTPGLVTRNGEGGYERGMRFTENALFKIFDFEWIQGDPDTALTEPNTVVLTESIANKYFPGEDPMGKTLDLEDRFPMTVVGVVRDLPENTHFHIDLFGSLDLGVTRSGRPVANVLENWGFNIFNTYILLEEGAAIADIESGLADFVTRHVPANNTAAPTSLTVLALRDLHLFSVQNEHKPVGDPGSLIVLTAVAISVLVIACINFMNLSTARAAQRAREIGMRKVMGAARGRLIAQFLGESVFMTLLAFVLALAFIELAFPAFVALVGRNITLSALDGSGLVPALLVLVVAAGVLAGSYPAFYLSSFRAGSVLKGDATRGKAGVLFRNLLVLLQFSVSITLIVATVVVVLQTRFARTADLGFQPEQVVIVEGSLQNGLGPQWRELQQRLREHPGIADAAASFSTTPLGSVGSASVVFGEGSSEERSIYSYRVGPRFMETYDIELLTGQTFSADRVADQWVDPTPAVPQTQAGIVLNLTAARELGWTAEEAIGKDVRVLRRDIGGDAVVTGRVLGVVRDAWLESVRQPIKPLYFYMPPDYYANNQPGYVAMSMRLTGADVAGTLAYIEETWQAFNPDIEMRLRFLEQSFAAVYAIETRQGTLLQYFSGLALILASVGLLGLAAFNAERRTREIGIRKVMGGSVWSIVILLTSDFSKLVLLSNLIAWPLAYVAMDRWLENFAYRIELTPLIFIGSGTIALCIAWVTVGGTAAKAANQKPVLALRYE